MRIINSGRLMHSAATVSRVRVLPTSSNLPRERRRTAETQRPSSTTRELIGTLPLESAYQSKVRCGL